MKVDLDILVALSDVEITGRSLVLRQHLNRSLYLRTQKVLEAAGGRWSRKEQAHLFESAPTDRIEQILLTGEITVPKDFGFFPTSAAMVAHLIELAEIEPWMLTLEPSAGDGAIARELAQLATVECFEIQPEKAAALREDNFAREVFAQDFLQAAPSARYDRVVMNPPFAHRGDVRHVLHALRFLKPEGRLVSVMSAGVLFRRDRLTREFRDLLERRGTHIEVNPPDAFLLAGTRISTVTVAIPGVL